MDDRPYCTALSCNWNGAFPRRQVIAIGRDLRKQNAFPNRIALLRTRLQIELGLVRKEDTLLGHCLSQFWSSDTGVPSAAELIMVAGGHYDLMNIYLHALGCFACFFFFGCGPLDLIIIFLLEHMLCPRRAVTNESVMLCVRTNLSPSVISPLSSNSSRSASPKLDFPRVHRPLRIQEQIVLLPLYKVPL